MENLESQELLGKLVGYHWDYLCNYVLVVGKALLGMIFFFFLRKG